MGDDAGNFLFEYTGAARLRDTYHVLAPSHADQEGFLHVELMSHYRDSAPEIEIEVTVDIAGTVNPVGVIALAANGEWSTFSMALKPVGETVRPLKFMFTPKWKVSDSEGSPVVYLRNPVAERTGKQDT